MNTNNTDGFVEQKVDCPSCKKIAIMKCLNVNVKNRDATMISSVVCDHCGYKDNSTHDSASPNSSLNGALITCKFDDVEDLKRFVDLQSAAQIKFKKNDDIVEYSINKSGVYLVEGIIKDITNELKSLYSIEDEDNGKATHFGNDVVNRSVGLNISDTNSVKSVDDREKVIKAVRLLENLLEHPVFEMIIDDQSGQTRVIPQGKYANEFVTTDVEKFNDEKVFHKIYSKNMNNKKCD